MAHHYLKRFGFTLPEVLITLGIIGVVAALTIPNFIENYNKRATAVRLKKTYNTLATAIQASEAENGPLIDIAMDYWNKNTYYSGPEFIEKYLFPYLEVVEVKRNTRPPGGNSGYPTQFINFTLKDGTNITYNMAYYFWPWSSRAYKQMGHFWIYFPDKKPVIGKNRFYFTFSYKDKGLGSFTLTDYQKDANDILCDDTADMYNQCAQESAYYCTRMVICNNWEFPKEYPIKF